MLVEPLLQPAIGRLEEASTRIAFFVVGFGVGAWAPLIPILNIRLGLEEGQLGLVLLCLGIGSIVAMPFAGGLAGRIGCRKVLLMASAGVLIAFPAMASAPHPVCLAIALATFGAGIGTMDVVMNIQAVIVEKSADKPMMSGFHGLYSVGGIAGAGAMTALVSLNFQTTAASLVIVGICAILLASSAKGFLTIGGERNSSRFALPKGQVLLIGALCFVLFLAEGSVLDWSGVFLAAIPHVDVSRSGFGYIAFALTMTLGRLFGDPMVRAVGRKPMMVAGALIAAIGFIVAIGVPNIWISTLGFGLVGLGAANVVPILFTAAGSQTVMPANLAVSAVTTMGYAGILVGPAMIGFLAQATNLGVALFAVAGLLLLVPICASRVITAS